MLHIDKKDFGSSCPLIITTSEQIVKSPAAAVHDFDEDFANKKAAENLNKTLCDPMK